ncbi:MFS transporter [Nonomuraea diastatica]|uniref:MFS transporter n=1 Tax=Nonomuraea diastatica TaxID=1848329 RepID=UPI001C70AC3D|nr:MFS transporter [Nonomuraea diastatica]
MERPDDAGQRGGLGIAVGPLLGGALGHISWRGPFYGVAVLMAFALVATILLVRPQPKPPRKTSLLDPLKALRHRGLLIMSLTALCYNWGFSPCSATPPSRWSWTPSTSGSSSPAGA